MKMSEMPTYIEMFVHCKCNYRCRKAKALRWLRHCVSWTDLRKQCSWCRFGLWTNPKLRKSFNSLNLCKIQMKTHQRERLFVRGNPLVDSDGVVQPFKYESCFAVVDGEVTVKNQRLGIFLQVIACGNSYAFYFNGSTHWTIYDVRMLSMWEFQVTEWKGKKRRVEQTNHVSVHEIKLLNKTSRSGGSYNFIDHMECFSCFRMKTSYLMQRFGVK